MLKKLLSFFESLLIAVIAAIIITTYIFRAVTVDGMSMYPTLQSNDRLIVEKVTYYFSKPKKGDVVVIKYPADNTKMFIKRIIAVGGDRLRILDGNLFINGNKVYEPYIFEKMDSSIDSDFKKEITVDKGTIFVMGDNRNQSKDSRYADVGFINLSLVVGKAVFKIYPFNNLGRIR